MSIVAALLLAVLADQILGEPGRFHPLVGFGRYAQWLETKLRRADATPRQALAAGALAWLLAVTPFCALLFWLQAQGGAVRFAVNACVLYFALGARSLEEHAEAVASALTHQRLTAAQENVARMVSRDSTTLDAEGVARAATESVLENGHDAIFGAIFWFCLLGAAGAVLFRLGNTLDAMWGYKTPIYQYFGRLAARLDDALGFIPARLTALGYALLGHTGQALDCWSTQAGQWSGGNAGCVMAAGAGALNVRLGGSAAYHGEQQQRPVLGMGQAADAHAINRARRLVRLTLVLWLAVIALFVISITPDFFSHA